MLVMLLWVPFRADSVTFTVHMWAALFSIRTAWSDSQTLGFLEPQGVTILLAAAGITLVPCVGCRQSTAGLMRTKCWHVGGIAALFVLALLQLIAQGFTPFIYANF